ncbi:MAG TPA: rhodanese-like domain-containing protein [Gaiellaceae bacterium]|nr:rhodanese-like domain-containing protein [Gaiellaceae bacterium]
MAATLVEVSREELWEKLQRGDPLVLVDARAPMSHAASRLPGAINIPVELVDERAPEALPDQDAAIAVYCGNTTCDASVVVAKRLVELGYRNVVHYDGGRDDWGEAGLPLEGGRV